MAAHQTARIPPHLAGEIAGQLDMGRPAELPDRTQRLQSKPRLRGSETPLYLVLGRQKGLGRSLVHPWFTEEEVRSDPCLNRMHWQRN